MPAPSPAADPVVFPWWRRAHAHLREHHARMDPRTAGLFRIVIGFVCAADTIRRWTHARVYYSNEGVLTNHLHLFRPSSPHGFSLYHAFSSVEEVHLAFALSVLCHLLLMIGWHTRVFAVISFLLVTSLDSRLLLVENGGYVVMNLVMLYAMFLPIERRLSVDALRRSLRERKERSLAELNERWRPARETEDHVSLGVSMVTWNLAIIYFFNVVNKSGDLWRKGETVHHVLHLDRMATGLAVILRQALPDWATRGLTWWTLCHEALLVPLILWPRGRRVTRSLAMIGIWLLHLAFGTVFRLGPFAWIMIGWSFALMARDQWDLLERWARERARPTTVIVDGRSPLAFLLSRVLARLDRLSLLTFEAGDPEGATPPLLAARGEDGKLSTGREALAEIARALPGGRDFWPFVRVGSLGLAGAAFTWAEAHREGVARFFGITVPPAGREERESEIPILSRLGRFRRFAREALLAYLAVCFFFQLIIENKSIPPRVREALALPAFMQATINYPRLYQGWSMFAPNPITEDGVVAIDARTVDGRRLDPFTGEEPDLDLTDARGLGLSQIEQDYWNRIRADRNAVYRSGLSDYLLAHHLRTGRPEDELVSFDVYWVRDRCPAMGSSRPHGNEAVAILSYRKPGYHPARGLSPLPPQPKIGSADTRQPGKDEPRTFFGWKLPAFMQVGD